MKCPNCGCEMAKEHLYCENCGNEIRIVPDFEPELENSISETLSTVGEEIEADGKKSQEVTQNAGGKASDTRLSSEKKGRKKRKKERKRIGAFRKSNIVASLIIFVIVVLLTVFAGIFLYQRYSVSYQLEQSEKHAGKGEYEEAIAYLEKAEHLSPGQTDIALTTANYYYLLGENQSALDVLLKHVDTVALEEDEKELVYEKIIGILAQEERYEEINSLLLKSEDISVQTRFQQYMAMTPEFSYVAGSYEKVIPLKISANTTGKIYYTLDGSEPGKNSPVYTAPIFLESGEYQIAAVFINEYGIKSDIARSWYMINLTVPDEPKLLLYSGEYNIPTMIEVVVPQEGTVYYTTDGSNPTADSLVYTEPIEMPLGKSNFKFVTISKEGVSSPVVSRSFDFDLKTDVSVNQAIVNVISALYNRGVLRDLQGHSFEIEGRYVFTYDTIVEIPNMGYYYVLKEFEETVSGSRVQTERLYAVEVYSGTPNRLTYDENGNMGLIPLS